MKRRNEKLQWGLIVLALFMSVATIVGITVGTHVAADKTDEVSKYDYTIGAIDETGKLIESKKSLYTEEMQTVEGLTIELDEETANITYKVAFYNEDGEFVSMTEAMSEDFDATTIPEGVAFFRIVITPNQVDDEDVTVTIWNVGKYAKQLEVSYSK